jgi:hypothetical protein
MADLRARLLRQRELETADWLLLMDNGHRLRASRL